LAEAAAAADDEAAGAAELVDAQSCWLLMVLDDEGATQAEEVDVGAADEVVLLAIEEAAEGVYEDPLARHRSWAAGARRARVRLALRFASRSSSEEGEPRRSLKPKSRAW
jgi:hypothetical protein